ncbi:ATP-binding protein [Halioglobus japonicus]|uniref:DUF2062 domain-containing protein n=1 Tax=Halioglobus japonicus TaxID=930805 RepID=A0AAP8MFH3_9GAMM|nr:MULTISPECIES: DUF2062 domain-containing protein [Halioglobus]AQA18763.1 ATP-binding protein [Halioglobus japonicus]KZX60223.1 ATP-binding protein [Halioglobus sp. HI00S01]PLW86795.1 DUF2062 domain-containing protein [Halioglobus japonicus]GHD11030.1 hypothetical protein GCM10007052_10290 [Halioglobus japonicus]
MPKDTLKSITPSPERIRSIKSLRVLGDWVYATNLWHINRYSSAMAFFVGLFVAFMPVPGQMLIAACLAVLLRCNLPLSVGLVWITNPVTMPAIFYLAYKVGAMIIDVPMQPIEFELSFYWLSTSTRAIWLPFLTGCFICGLFFGSVGYFVISILWRMRVARMWRERKKRRQAKLS